MKPARKLILVVITSFTLVSCTLNMEKMRSTFDEHLQKTVGRTFSELKSSPTQAFIGEREPEKISQVSDNQVLHMYDYWTGAKMVRDGNCKVYLYFEKISMVVTKAKSEGKGCYTAY